MYCQQFQHRLNALLDQRQSPEDDRALRLHAQNCEDCQSVLDTQRELFACLGHRPSLHRERPRQAAEDHRKANAWMITGGVAAAIFVILATATRDRDLDRPSHASRATTVAVADGGTALSSTAPKNASLWAGVIHGDLSGLIPQETQLADEAWLDQVSGGIRPLTSSMSSTLNVLKRTWPGSSRSETTNEPQASNQSAGPVFWT